MTIRVGILGCARIAKAAMVDAAAQVPGLEVVAVASRDASKAAAYARQHGIAGFHGSYDALIADPDVDVIYIPLPNGLHEEWSIRALNAGKGVLCEKPFAANAEAAQRMADCARSTGIPLMEAVHYRFHPLAQFVDEVVRSGRLGQLTQIDSGLEIPGSLVDAGDIRFQHELAGGAMMDLGTYCLSALRWIAAAEPTEIDASADVIAPGVDRAMQVRLGFASGLKGSFECSLAAAEFKVWLTVTGSAGTLHIDNPFLPQMGHRLTIDEHGVVTHRTFDKTPTYVFQVAAFAALWRGEQRTLITPEDSVANMAAIDAIYRAAGLEPRR